MITLFYQSDFVSKGLKLNSKVIPGNVLMELETITVWGTLIEEHQYKSRWRYRNITARNVKLSHSLKLFIFNCYLLLALQFSPLSTFRGKEYNLKMATENNYGRI
jgi:hypothetical protein